MHNHDHNHSHCHSSSSSRIACAFFLNAGFAAIEFIGGWLTNSTAIMADAVHDLGDCLAIGMAWALEKLSGKKPNEDYSYGYRRFSLMGSFINGAILLGGSIWVLNEAVPRLTNPTMPHAEGMLAIAIFGVAVNGYAAYKLSHGHTLNERMLNWHLLEDVLGWLAVLIVSIALMFVDWPILDPLLSVAFTLFILVNVMRTLWQAGKLFLQAVPDKALLNQIAQSLQKHESVKSIHHVHMWSLDGEHHVLTAHIVLVQAISLAEQSALKLHIAQSLHPFDITHTTIEFEFADEICRDQNPSQRHLP